MPPTVLLDATPLARGHSTRGIGAYTRLLIDALASTLPREERPTLLTVRGHPAPPGFDRAAIRWPRWPVSRIPDPWPAIGVEREVRRLGARLFHATQPELLPGQGSGVTVATCYDLIPHHHPSRNPSHRAAYRRYERRLRTVRLITAISQATADDLTRTLGIPAHRIRVTPLGVPPLATPAGPTPSHPYVLYSNGIETHKNPQLAVDAVARASGRLRLVMTGTWSRRRLRELQERARAVGAAGRVDWLGHVQAERLAALRRDAIAVLVPSWVEGFGLPLLEALAAGTPAIASDIPALRETGGDAAILLHPGDVDAWTHAIERLADTPEERPAIADRGRARAAAFTWERTARLTVDAWREALA